MTLFGVNLGHAKDRFSAYDGPDAVQTGSGGTKTTANGIDYWTSGTPPRQYKIVGMMIDTRRHGDVIGSKELARKTKELNADAVILEDQETHPVGAFGSSTTSFSGRNAFGFGSSAIQNRTKSRVLVVKYLPAG